MNVQVGWPVKVTFGPVLVVGVGVVGGVEEGHGARRGRAWLTLVERTVAGRERDR